MARIWLAAAIVLIAGHTIAAAQGVGGDTYNQQLFAPSYTVDNRVTGGGDSTSTNITRYQGSYRLRNTPDVQPPSIVGGNPCSVGASGGFSIAGLAVAAGATYADTGCERRNVAAILFNMGQPDAGLAVMCNNVEVRDAMRMLGRPCLQDRAAAPAPAAPPSAPAPVPGAIQPISTVPARFGTRPAWCDRAQPVGPAEVDYIRRQCG